MSKCDLDKRMKGYENIERKYLTRRIPLIVRLDGRSFHTFTNGFLRPFDPFLSDVMQATAKDLCANIQGCKMAYTQSDEISLLLTDYDSLTTDAWFDKNVQKIVSVSASMITLYFNNNFAYMIKEYSDRVDLMEESPLKDNLKKSLSIYTSRLYSATFDSRTFTIPKEEVCNYFIWRQNDATINAIQMAAQANFSHKELLNLSCSQLQDKLFTERNINFNDYKTFQKRGTCIVKKDGWLTDFEIPIFSKDRYYIEKYVYLD